MPDSPEHKAITEALDQALQTYSETRLLGIREAERRKFDFGCMLLRDTTRPLVSQVLWSHSEGIEKDLRTLVFDAGSSIRMYFVRDQIRNRAKIDEILQAYGMNEMTRPLLRGLRIIPVPEGFDADSSRDRDWMNRFLLEGASADLLFGVVFGKLTAADVRTFALHGGPFGLKMAALHVVATSGYYHGPTFQDEVGSKGSPLREVLAMLTGVGLIISDGPSVQRVATIKGRFLLDLARRLTFEWRSGKGWSEEIRLVLNHLRIAPIEVDELSGNGLRNEPLWDLLHSSEYAARQFGIDIMSAVDGTNPKFYSDLPIDLFTTGWFNRFNPTIWSDPDDVTEFGNK